MKMTITFLGIIFLFLSGWVHAEDSWKLGFLQKADPSKDTLTFADVADPAKCSPDLLARYGGVALPKAGVDGGLQPSQVLLALGRAGADLGRIELVTPADVRILQGQGSDVMDQLKKTATAALAKSLGKADADIHLELDRIAQNLPEHSLFKDLSVEVKDHSGDSAHFIVIFKDESGHTVSATEVSGKITTSHKVVVAARDLMPGDFVTGADFHEVATEDIAGQDVITTLADLGSSRWQLSEGVSEGKPLKRQALNYSILLKKGAVVTLVSRQKGFEVRALGRVKEVMDGGTSVLVENVDSKKDIVGKPLSLNEVQIVY